MMMKIVRTKENEVTVNGAMVLDGQMATNILKGLWNNDSIKLNVSESVEVTPTRFASLMKGM